MEPRERHNEIFRMDVFVWGSLLSDFPPVRRAWGWRDKEQLLALREMQVLVYRFDWSFLAKVYAYSLVHNVLAVEQLADADGIIGGVKGNNDAPEGFEGRPGMDWGGFVDEVANCEEVGRVEDFWVDEVGYEEGVRRRRGLNERRER